MSDPVEIVVPTTTEGLHRRLNERLCPIGDVWFPTRAEMDRWDESDSPLYVRWIDRSRFEIGPRLDTVPSARFVPVWHFRIVNSEPGGNRTVLHFKTTWTRITWVVFGLLLAGLVGWGWTLVSDMQQENFIGWATVWFLSMAAVGGGCLTAWIWGKRRLLEEADWLKTILERVDVAGEDWGR